MKKNRVLIILLTLLMIFCLLACHEMKINNAKLEYKIEKINGTVNSFDSLHQTFVFIKYVPTPIEYQTVRITSYYNGDDCGSGDTTASGKTIYDFETNENGWYTYNGMLVIASATNYYRTDVDLKPSYQRYDLYDVISLTINNVDYEGIVLDVCGGSYWNEKHQRYDLFVSNDESAITTKALVEL